MSLSEFTKGNNLSVPDIKHLIPADVQCLCPGLDKFIPELIERLYQPMTLEEGAKVFLGELRATEIDYINEVYKKAFLPVLLAGDLTGLCPEVVSVCSPEQQKLHQVERVARLERFFTQIEAGKPLWSPFRNDWFHDGIHCLVRIFLERPLTPAFLCGPEKMDENFRTMSEKLPWNIANDCTVEVIEEELYNLVWRAADCPALTEAVEANDAYDETHITDSNTIEILRTEIPTYIGYARFTLNKAMARDNLTEDQKQYALECFEQNAQILERNIPVALVELVTAALISKKRDGHLAGLMRDIVEGNFTIAA